MNAREVILGLTMASTLVTVARSGHELPVYPSYYPHEIEIATVAPEPAASLLAEGKLHAHVGGELRYAGVPPDTLRAIESLGSIVIVRDRRRPVPVNLHALYRAKPGARTKHGRAAYFGGST